jgi:hypothetical protein
LANYRPHLLAQTLALAKGRCVDEPAGIRMQMEGQERAGLSRKPALRFTHLMHLVDQRVCSRPVVQHRLD